MADGFNVTEQIAAAPTAVWAYLIDFRNAGEWMTGVEGLAPTTEGLLEVGTRLSFVARGKARETRVSALEPGKRIALKSTQGGVTATYDYALAPAGEGTEISLKAVCEARGLWKLLHPLIVVAMRKSDSSQLANLKAVMVRHG